ncbi:MAG: GntR family transcriptional regulator [Cyclobacteriaceae bacterium]|nr:MAG: GntR family transcriptional regulator [Cyclobacteriaceae bacterium]
MKNKIGLKHKIKPINTLSLVDKVELSLMEFFSENKLQPGDSIPKELEISESLGVSRTVVREALLRLRTLGLVESKKHRGMVVTQPDVLIGFEKVLDPKFHSEETLKDIFELRLTLEMGMADLLLARKTPEDLTELEQIVAREEKNNNDTTKFSLKQEVDFHGKLYQMSGNRTLQRFQNLLLPAFEYVHDHGFFDKDYIYSKKNVSHRDLFETIKTGSPEAFREAMRQHLEPHYDKVL